MIFRNSSASARSFGVGNYQAYISATTMKKVRPPNHGNGRDSEKKVSAHFSAWAYGNPVSRNLLESEGKKLLRLHRGERETRQVFCLRQLFFFSGHDSVDEQSCNVPSSSTRISTVNVLPGISTCPAYLPRSSPRHAFPLTIRSRPYSQPIPAKHPIHSQP